jgi:hypothetical protein
VHDDEKPVDGVRWDLVNRVRRCVALGVYDEPEVLEETVEAILQRLRNGDGTAQ